MRWTPRLSGPPRRSRALLASAMALAMVGAGASIANAAPEANTVTVVDPSPVNWLSVTWNTMEEVIRVDKDGKPQPALATDWKWNADGTELTLNLRKGVVFQDGEKFDAKVFRKAFDQVQRWESPHPPGSFLNYDKATKLEIVDDYTVKFTLPKPDGAFFMKLRGMHVGSSAFWDKLAFVNTTKKNAEGNW